MIRVGAVAAPCICAHDYWTIDGGRHWVATGAIQGGLIGRGTSLYWVKDGTELQRVIPWPPVGRIKSQSVGSVDKGTIVSTAPVPGGVAALVRDGISGKASILVVNGDGRHSLDLPDPPGALLDQSLSVSGSTLVVDATVFDDGAAQKLRWSSDDRRTWSVAP